jgi:hypothetical protein
VSVVDRYGPAINADFRSLFGVRLLDFFTGKEPWGEFWRLLSQLGADSRYMKAQQDDPEMAQRIAEAEDPDDPSWSPQAADWTLMHELMASVRDLLVDVVIITGKGLPSDGPRRFPPPYPRPDTELEKARKRVAEIKLRTYDDKILAEVERAKDRWRAMKAQEQPS